MVPTEILPVLPAYRWVLAARAAVFWVPLLIGSLIADQMLLAETPFARLLPLVMIVLTISAVFVAPARIYRRLGYALDDRLLRVVHGWMFHTDTVVPFVRVQHIDVTRGPLDKLFGTATLVVHTAGTHNSIVALPGLSPDRALQIRDTIRAEIRADGE